MEDSMGRLFLFISTMINSVQGFEYKSLTFVQYPTISSTTSLTDTTKINCYSSVFCASVCLEEPECKSFSFNHIDRSCILRNKEKVGRNLNMEQNGWSHFIQLKPPKTPKTYVRMCYYTNWSEDREGDGKFLPEDIDPFLCTHILYAYADLQNGKLTNSRANDLDSDSEKGLYSRVIALKDINPSLKVLLSVGGPDSYSGDFSSIASFQESRQTFVNSIITLCRQHGFDGFDMDWQYPTLKGGMPDDYKDFGLLIEELRSEFAADASLTRKDRLLLTVAVSATKSVIDVAYNVTIISRNVDYVLIQAYDFVSYKDGRTGHHSPLYSTRSSADQTACVEYAVEYWNEIGVPKRKIVVGMPAYGRTFELTGSTKLTGALSNTLSAPFGTYTRFEGFMSYYEVMDLLSKGGNDVRDPGAYAEYYYNMDGPTQIWVSYETPYSIYNKIWRFIVPGGYAGAMIYALPLDDFKPINDGGKYPLVNEMKRALVAATDNK